LEDGEQTPINASAATAPSLRSTWSIALVAVLLNKMLGRETQPNAAIQAEAGDSDDAEPEKPDQERDRNDIKSMKTGPAAQKAGGRRRKATRK
jgi:hypothetical protein